MVVASSGNLSDPDLNDERRYAPGDVIADKYRLVRSLGVGGMGEVWEALNVALDAAVAIKLIRAELEAQPIRERLINEARAAAQVAHPSIVRVFDVGETGDGAPFIVMELLRGESLGHALVRRGRLPATLSVQTLLPIADGLSTAHRANLVHRDLKPDNVFLAESGEHGMRPKLLDFGVVKIAREEQDRKLTGVGIAIGSPAYMSPEQARGLEDVDHRSDVWAFSVMLYEMLTGEMPFNGSNYNATMRAIIEEEPKSVKELASVDTRLSDIVSAGLRKDRAQRIPSIDELGQALAAWLLGQEVYEDAAGNGIEARWVQRRSSPGRRSLDSIELATAARRGSSRTPVEASSSVDSGSTLESARRLSSAPEASPHVEASPAQGSFRWLGMAVILVVLCGGIAGVAVWFFTAGEVADASEEQVPRQVTLSGEVGAVGAREMPSASAQPPVAPFRQQVKRMSDGQRAELVSEMAARPAAGARPRTSTDSQSEKPRFNETENKLHQKATEQAESSRPRPRPRPQDSRQRDEVGGGAVSSSPATKSARSTPATSSSTGVRPAERPSKLPAAPTQESALDLKSPY